MTVPGRTEVLVAGPGVVRSGSRPPSSCPRAASAASSSNPRPTVSYARPRCKTVNVRTMEHLRRWKIAAVRRGWGGPGLLDSYETKRRPVQDRVIREAETNMRSLLGPGFTPLTPDDEPVPAIDAAGVPLTIRSAPVNRFVLVRPDQHVAWHGDRLPDDPRALLDRARGVVPARNDRR